MNARIPIDHAKLSAFCSKWGVSELALFGSVLRDDFRPDSDVDVLVSFHSGVRRTLADLLQMEEELSRIFGRKVDLVERRLVEHSENYIRRNHILTHMEVLDVA